MRRVLALLGFCALVLSTPSVDWSATNNTGNNPAFLVVQVVSNGWLDQSQDTIDIGVDIGADGTYDYWLSEDISVCRESQTNRDEILPEGWMNLLILLDQYAGETAKIKIIDKSDQYYIAVNSIRLNNADGSVVSNPVPNGSFEDDPPLSGWTVLEGNLTAEQLIATDEEVWFTPNGTKFFSTLVQEAGGDTAVVESDAFVLTPLTSFVYGTFAGPASSHFDKPGAWESGNGILVYVDVGTETEDPDGQYTDGVDVPVKGILYDDSNLSRISLQVSILNTSGLEGRRAQVVAVDNDPDAAVAMDCLRMNWDNSVIRNGGFEEGFEDGYPEGFEGFEIRALDEHPGGSIPGWAQTKTTDDPYATWSLFGWPGAEWTRSGRVWLGTGSYVGDPSAVDAPAGYVPEFVGLEFRSDVFVIQPIPEPSGSVFMSFNSAQVSAKQNPDGQYKSVELEVDVDGNGEFGDAGDFTYAQANQGGGWNREQYSVGGIDEWQYPDYRFYIAPEHQGKSARIYVSDTMEGGWAWMGVDDFYFWDGSTADLAFPNSDFEMGDMTNWNEEIEQQASFTSWLAGNQEKYDEGLVTQMFLNDHISGIDGEYAADSAQQQGGSGDDNIAFLWSDPFTIPSLQVTAVKDWPLFE